MYHPGIVSVHDWGTIGHGQATWYAMEYSMEGSLTVASIGDWPAMRVLLIQVLRSLAHAHARDVVHRDLKPANILIFGEVTSPTYRLADFGISHLRIPSADTSIMGGVSGTPLYMPPEQVHGWWREYGPWTDLYALGCLAFEIASGAPPFLGASPFEVAMQQITAPRPALAPRFAVPPELADWIGRLLSVDWRNRPKAAAPLLYELEAFSAPIGGPRAAVAPPVDASAQTVEMTTRVFGGGFERADLVKTRDFDPPGREAVDYVPSPSQVSAMVPPKDWRATTSKTGGFFDTGLQLFELRQTEFVGYENIRDATWSKLLEAVETSSPRATVLGGDNQRELALFADWLVTRVRETSGFSSVSLRLAHGEPEFAAVVDALMTLVNAHGLPRDRLEEHLGRRLPGLLSADDELIDSLVEVLGTDRSADAAPAAVMPVFYDVVVRLAERAPLLISIDGAGEERWPWQLAEVLLTHDHLPIFVLLTERTTTADRDPSRSEASLRQSPLTTGLRLGGLDRDEAAAIMDSFLAIEPRQRETLIDVAVDDPEFAVEMIRWPTKS